MYIARHTDSWGIAIAKNFAFAAAHEPQTDVKLCAPEFSRCRFNTHDGEIFTKPERLTKYVGGLLEVFRYPGVNLFKALLMR